VSEKHRTGRPLKEHPAGTQVTITLQVPAELKLKLQAKAVSSNRTLSQESQRRLERSFSAQALQEDAVSLAAEAAHAQFSKRLTDELAARAKTDTEQVAKQLAEQLAELRRLGTELAARGTELARQKKTRTRTNE
jgi:hypothetical protein